MVVIWILGVIFFIGRNDCWPAIILMTGWGMGYTFGKIVWIGRRNGRLPIAKDIIANILAVSLNSLPSLER